MFYFWIDNNKINGKSDLLQNKVWTDDRFQVEVTEEIYNDNIEKYIWNGENVELDPDYEEKQRQKEKERVQMLSCTKRDFALMLQELGVTYTQLKTLIASSEQAQLEWDLCERLYRFNPLLDVMAAQLGITSLQLDMIFKTINGENSVDELKSV